jgi:endonuclease G, mitochondrial
MGTRTSALKRACDVFLVLALASCAVHPATTPPRTAPWSLRPEARATTLCPEHYLAGRPPEAAPPLDPGDTYEICYTHFAVLHASATLTPLWSAEHLEAWMARGGDSIGDQDAFHAEEALEDPGRARPTEYRNSGYDRGHMTPADDMPNAATQRETYTMANMAPQAGYLNQHLWASLEGALHMLAEQDGALFIVTGPVYGANPRRINGRVAIPTAVYKAVYDPADDSVIVFYALNRDDARCTIISLDELERRSGVTAFPSLRATVRAAVSAPWDLPGTNRGTAPPDCR